MLVASLPVLAAVLIAGPFDAPAPRNDSACMGAPLELTWGDLLRMGETSERIVQRRCGERLESFALKAPARARKPLVAGRLRLGSFQFAGERIGFGLDVLTGPEEAFHGPLPGRPAVPGLEEVRVVPNLYLPEPWMEKIDAATYPVLIAGTAAMATWMIVDLFR